MAGLTIRFDDGGATAGIRKLIRQMEDPRPALRIVGAVLVDSIEENFKEGGRPPWKKSKRAEREGGQTLVKTRNLENSLTDSSKSTKIEGGTLYVGTNVEYAAIHNFGGKIKAHTIKAKRAKCLSFMLGNGDWVHAKSVNIPEITMPARPFLVARDEDMEEAAAQIIEYLQGEIGK
jgi:phage gpG-like protein